MVLNVRPALQHLDYEDVLAIQQQVRLPFAVCALNVHKDLNIATMIRTAVVLGASDFYVFGRRAIDRRGTVGAQNYINLFRVEGLDDEDISTEKFENWVSTVPYTPIFCETDGEDYRQFDYSRIGNPMLVMGEEQLGLPEDIKRKYTVRVPQVGVTKSLNVSIAAAIIMEEVSRQLRGD